MTTKRVYLCANAWIAFINKEPGYQDVEHLINTAMNGECQIWTSALSIAEVYKASATGQAAKISDEKIDSLFEQGYVVLVAADLVITKDARALLRKYNPPLKKPFDAVHLATAARHNCDEFITYDREDLLSLNGKVPRQDGTMLEIKKPESSAGPLFNRANDDKKTGTN